GAQRWRQGWMRRLEMVMSVRGGKMSFSKFSVRVTRNLATAFALCAGIAVSRPAQAALGDGLELGPGRLKLGVDITLRYDTAASTAAGSGLSGDLIGLARGKFLLNINTDMVKVDFGGSLDWNQYFGVSSPDDRALSFLGANAQGTLEINK